MRVDNPLLRRLYHERMSAYWTGRVRQFEEPRATLAIRYGASFPRYDEFTDDFLTVGLSVNWPIAKFRLDRAKRDQARHRVRQLELEEDIVNNELDTSLRETQAAYLKSLQRLEARNLEVELAAENLRLSKIFRERGQPDTQVPEDVSTRNQKRGTSAHFGFPQSMQTSAKFHLGQVLLGRRRVGVD